MLELGTRFSVVFSTAALLALGASGAAGLAPADVRQGIVTRDVANVVTN